MTIDIIPITEEELAMLDSIQLKLIRTAQQKKDELTHKLERQLIECENMCYANKTYMSSVHDDLVAELTDEYDYQVEILREQLIFNLSLREPVTDPGETGGPTTGGDGSGYVVDYRLSYMDRYIAVRDYYLAIEDPNERVALYAADEVAMAYLGTYYNYLFNYLVSLR